MYVYAISSVLINDIGVQFPLIHLHLTVSARNTIYPAIVVIYTFLCLHRKLVSLLVNE